ncbi:Piso0_001525 [Millerozyma farinosa CBS 7064]|uniref:Alkyl transferase n=1 Tax=Pichia sorbitophila (strain ATCC MYA-4447 / BCRC 22081 / CBS 7064 / NBRC 10061 / NRRL Y-12695) TaxID=559304 RepID=G8YL12_PICSO|nr:Piso0_001525 [Millerozyma farinosa CBS 7064]
MAGQGKTNLISLNGILGLISSFPLITYILEFLKDLVINMMKTAPVPKHIALIMDGNRRYAKSKKLALSEGHSAGADSLIQVLNTCYKLGVAHVTIYAFSIENFNRSQEEVETLFGLLRNRLSLLADNEDSYARINKIKVRIVGNKSLIPEDILQDLEAIEAKTNNLESYRVLNVCFPYTSRDDIAHSVRTISDKVAHDIIRSSDITLETLNENMYMGADTPPLDILVRTSGHTRLSDFMLWQANDRCVIEFVDVLWPDFKFLNIVSVILKWSYYRTLEMEEGYHTTSGTKEKKISSPDIYANLPPPPPLASVTQR